MGGSNSKKKKYIITEFEVLNESLNSLKEQKIQYESMIHNRRAILESMSAKKNNLERQIKILSNENSKYSSFECKICFDRVIDVMCLPCCHTYCERCSNNMKKCFICNTNVAEKVKIYN